MYILEQALLSIPDYFFFPPVCPLLPLSATLGFYRGQLGDDVMLEKHPV